ncbi:hypothetical protein [Microlunatus soli]|uniref:Uncharacterized protein n=1 Tax=Microlunatus soli TaxID=630515 RepID=A0A1H1UML8_9ACTN|nr:hypothetical protein [Microlunatus soli]SDS73570.1 hypothetical protein SAMN04489812_2849 [Microlunatus soli]
MLSALAVGGMLLTGCQDTPQPSPSNRPPASASATGGPSTSATSSAGGGSAKPTQSASPSRRASPGSTVAPEPTTSNTLPAPPEPTAPAPKSAGPLTKKDLPRPAGWQPVARPGGAEEGYRGNGTWVQGRDPRYAAQDTITIGCAPVTRDDYPDPISALQATYGKKGATSTPGIGLAMQFGSTADAKAYYGRYLDQVRACDKPDGPMLATVIDSDLGLIDQRRYADGTEWTEMAGQRGKRVTLVILTDPGHTIDRSAAESVLRQLKG